MFSVNIHIHRTIYQLVPYVAIQTTIAKDEGLTTPCTLVPERVIRVIGCETLTVMYINAEKFTLRIRKIHFCMKKYILKIS